jgi:nitroreductase
MIAKAPMVWVFLADYQKWVDYFKGENCEEKSKRPWVNPGWGDLHLGLQDAIIAAQSAVIAADALDIGSCYIGDILENGEKVQELLNLPEFTIPACMLIFGYKKDIKVTKLTARCPINSIFMKDTYHRQNLEEIRTSYGEQERQSRETKRLPYDNQGSLADYYYNRKYTSSFMKEMNRSVNYWFNRWLASC